MVNCDIFIKLFYSRLIFIDFNEPQPTESGNQRFKLSRIHDTEIDLISGEVVFEVELELSHDNQRLFLGLMDTHRTNEKSMSMQSGIAVSINTKNGELRDPINDQNVIGSINTKTLLIMKALISCAWSMKK